MLFLQDIGKRFSYKIIWQKSRYFKDSIKPLYGINQAKISLVFLSKINNDTRRCFEIPATKTMMLSEYTDDLAQNLFEEGREADYFKSKEELLEKIQYYLNNESEIAKIGNAGYERLMKDGHEVKDRTKQIMQTFEKLR